MSTDYVDDRLHAWARWVLSSKGPQGFSKETPLYRMARDGVPIRVEGYRIEEEAIEEEETDKAVMTLKANIPQLWDVLAVHYCGKGTVSQKCKDVGLSRSTYYERLRFAQDKIDDYLSEMSQQY